MHRRHICANSKTLCRYSMRWNVMWCNVMWCDFVGRDMIWRGVISNRKWSDVIWCNAIQWDVKLSGVPSSIQHSRWSNLKRARKEKEYEKWSRRKKIREEIRYGIHNNCGSLCAGSTHSTSCNTSASQTRSTSSLSMHLFIHTSF